MTKKSRVHTTSDFPYAIRSFLGYLEGTSKALHTIKSYRLDLLSFQRFLKLEQSELGDRSISLEAITPDNIERYHSWLKSQGLKNNTRRRKLLTVQKFANYLAQRKKTSQEIPVKYPTPHKVERIPAIVSLSELLNAIQKLPAESILDLRNRALLWTMAETGCLVSEVTRLRYENWILGSHEVEFVGKSQRKLHISERLGLAIEELREKTHESQSKPCPWVFSGFNKFGSLGSPITPRGVELLVKHYASQLGFPELTPRTFRHSAVIHWMEQGIQQKQIQEILGLKSNYAFRVYDLIVNARSSRGAS